MNAFRAPAKHRFLRQKLRNFDIMDRPLGATQRLRYKFVLRFDTTKRKPWTNKRTQNPFLRNEFTDSEQFVVEPPARPKTILPSISAQRRGTGITLQLSALRVMYKSKIGKVSCFSET